MGLPFSHDAFLDVFAEYNAMFWPAVLVLWTLSAAITIQLLRRGRVGGRMPFILLALHWAWSGIVYHWFFFRRINPAAAIFAALFVMQAALFLWLARTPRADVTIRRGPRGIVATALVLCALVYPVAGMGFGLRYPRMPLFAVPCPTTLFTAGLLLASTGLPRVVNIVPMLWAGIGSSAALLLGIRADVALVGACALLALDTFAPRVLGATGLNTAGRTGGPRL